MAWEFRFALKPTRENINKAVDAALPVLFSSDWQGVEPDFKFYLLNNLRNLLPKETGYEGPYVNLDNPSDRDQRGKEFCVYMLQDSRGQFERTPAEFKELILKLWKAFRDSGVEIGYISPQIGDRALPCDPGLTTPVSYSYTAHVRRWDAITNPFWEEIRRVGLPLTDDDFRLNDLEFNKTQTLYTQRATEELQGHRDPLAGVQISAADLSRHGIHAQAPIEMQAAKVKYLQNHYTQAVQDISRDLQAQKAKPSSFEKSLQKLQALASGTDLEDSKETRVIDENGHVTEAGLALVCQGGNSTLFDSLNKLLARPEPITWQELENLQLAQGHNQDYQRDFDVWIKKARINQGGTPPVYAVDKADLLKSFGKVAFLRKYREYVSDVENIIHHFPPSYYGGMLQPNDLVADLNNFFNLSSAACKKFDVIKFKNGYLPVIRAKQTSPEFKPGLQGIIDQFNADQNIKKFLTDNGITDDKLADMVTQDPWDMEIFYRRLRELKKERYFLHQESYRLWTMALKKGDFASLRWKTVYPALIIALLVPVGTGVAFSKFSLQELTHDFITGNSTLDHVKTLGLAVAGAFIIAAIGFLIYKGVRHHYDEQLVNACYEKDAHQVTAALVNGADPEVMLHQLDWNLAIRNSNPGNYIEPLLKDPNYPPQIKSAIQFFSAPDEVKEKDNKLTINPTKGLGGHTV